MSKLFVDEIVHQSSQGSGTITIGASGETISVPTGATMTVPNGGLSGQNYPAFEARLSSSQATDHNTTTKIQCGDEIFDTDSAYDASINYRFTPQVAGKYFCYFGLRGWAGGSAPDGTRFLYIQPYKNGSLIRNYASVDTDANEMRAGSVTASAVIEFNGSSDYLEFYGLIFTQNGLNPGVQLLNDQTYFGAYRIGA